VTEDISAWRSLAGRAEESNPFFGPEWLQAGTTQMGGGRVRVARIDDEGGQLIGLAPIASSRLGRLVPAVSIWTHLHAPLGTPLVDPEQVDLATERLIGLMDAGRTQGRILVFPYMPLEGPIASAIQRLAESKSRPVATIGVHRRAVVDREPAASPSIREALPRKKRRELDRQWRRLSETGRLTQDSAGPDDPTKLAAALAEFFTLEASGWKGLAGTALTSTDRDRRFAEAVLLEDPGVRMEALRLDGKAVAMLVTAKSGDTAVTWKIAHDERLARFSPGVQMMLEGVDALLVDPMIDHIDTLAVADHPMVDHLFQGRMLVGTLVVGPRGGSLGFQLGITLAAAEYRLRPLAKDWIRRIPNFVKRA
jgi:CelD/BcsL family acetyltransferase involved in cellulose biosynthesis